VPHQVSLTLASDQAQRAVGDTAGALLQAAFQLKAYVKRPALEGEGGAGGDR
jgi:hypothetical protein